jgi:hypothetical protein
MTRPLISLRISLAGAAGARAEGVPGHIGGHDGEDGKYCGSASRDPCNGVGHDHVHQDAADGGSAG